MERIQEKNDPLIRDVPELERYVSLLKGFYDVDETANGCFAADQCLFLTPQILTSRDEQRLCVGLDEVNKSLVALLE